MTSFRTHVDVLRTRVEQRGAETAFVFLNDGLDDESRFTFAELEKGARAVARALVDAGAAGKPVVLLFAPGLDFVKAFYGCLYAGAIAVPAYPPDPSRPARSLARTQTIVDDSGATVVLTSQMIAGFREQMGAFAPSLAKCTWICADLCNDDSGWQEPKIDGSSLAFLQYTSGSTGEPKGVAVSHANLLHNFELNVSVYGKYGKLVGWLPAYHDMGLVGHILGPVHRANTSVLFSPLHFLQNPFLWVRAISKHRGESSGAPNFAWDLCARKVTEEQKATLDLSCWDHAYAGAEPHRHDTLLRFQEAFRSCGFRPESLLPSYGLAEACLLVTARSGVKVLSVKKKLLEKDGKVVVASSDDDALSLVSNGPIVGDQTVVVVNVDTSSLLPANTVGEIWISSGSVAQGYWNKSELTEKVFGAKVAGDPRRYMRTGDQGFFDDAGELYVTGRLKDMIIVRGRNYYPQDIEASTVAAHALIRPSCCAAFVVDGLEGEGVGVCFELERSANVSDVETMGTILRAVRTKIAEDHEVMPSAVVIVQTGQVPKTSSGKIQRNQTRHLYHANEFTVVAEWKPTDDAHEETGSGPLAQVRAFIRKEFNLVPDAHMLELPLMKLGLDSLGFMKFRDFLRATWGMDLTPVELDEHTLGSLFEKIEAHAKARGR